MFQKRELEQTHMQKKKKNLDTDLTLFIKTDPQLIIDQNSKHKTIKEDNIGEKSW